MKEKRFSPTLRSLFGLMLTILLLTSLACNLPGLGGPTAVQTTPKAAEDATKAALNQNLPTAIPTPVQPTRTPRPRPNLPPAVAESNPSVNSEIPVKGPIAIIFNQAMDQRSVEAAIEMKPLIQGAFAWADQMTLLFTPDQPLLPKSELELTVNTSAKATNGLSFTAPVTLKYRTGGPLEVISVLPKNGATEVDPASAVVMAFSKPVVPFGERVKEPVPFRLDPPVEGRGEWLNTSTYIFYPKPALAGGQTYRVILTPPLQATDGMPLSDATPTEWGFSTLVPRIVEINPDAAWRLDQEISVKFNVAMDPDSVAANSGMIGSNGQSVPGSYTWEPGNAAFVFKPNNLLARDTEYTFTISGAAQARGGVPLESGSALTERTVPNFALNYSSPNNGEMVKSYGSSYGNVSFFFSAPVNKRQLEKFITINPPLGDPSYYVNGDTELSIGGTFEPSTQYTFTLSRNLTDQWGQALGNDMTFTFYSPAAQPNLITMSSQSGSRMSTLLPDENSISALSTNISSMRITVGKVPMNDLQDLISPSNYDVFQNYVPPQPKSWIFRPGTPADQSTNIRIPLTEDGSLLSPGVYYMTIQPAETIGWLYNGVIRQLVVVSPYHTTLKLSSNQVVVWGMNLQDGSPMAYAPISVYNANNQLIASGSTDEQGYLQTSMDPNISNEGAYFTYAIYNDPNTGAFALASSDWSSQGVYSFGLPIDWDGGGLEAYLYSDRPIYRPGQVISFRGIVRNRDNGRYTLPPNTRYRWQITGDGGMSGDSPVLIEQTATLDPYGAFSGQFTLPASASPGYYHIQILPADTKGYSFGSLLVKVANYRKPEIDLSLSLSAEQVRFGDGLQAHLNARYYFGAPAANTNVTWTLYSHSTSLYLPNYVVGMEDYSWLRPSWDYNFESELGQWVANGTGMTDAEGNLALNLSPEDLVSNGPSGRRKLTLEMTVVDQNNQPVSVRASALLNPETFYIGIQSDKWISSTGEPIIFTLQTVDWQGKPNGGHPIEAVFSKIKWEDDGTGSIISVATPVSSASPTTDGSGIAVLAFTPESAGTYRLDVKSGNAQSQHTVWVQGRGGASWPSTPDKKVRLMADADNYEPGDTAKIFVPNPFGRDVPALITLERTNVLSHRFVTISEGGSTIEVPLTTNEAPNTFFSIVMLGRNMQGSLDFRQGYINLVVDPRDLLLNVNLTVTPEQAVPGQEVTVRLDVTDSAGNPVLGEFSMSVADKAALALSDANSQPIRDAFYDIQGLGVRTSLGMAAYARGLETAAPMGGGRGGGGGDVMPAPTLRENFPDTAYWKAEILTTNGSAEVTFTLPDNLTTWIIDVRGLSEDCRVGQATDEIVTSKPLLIRPQTPRFLVAGDHALLSAVVHNNTGNDVAAVVSLDANGVTLDAGVAVSTQVTVPANSFTKVDWWVTAQTVPEADLIFRVEAGDLADSARPPEGKLPIEIYHSPQTFSTGGILGEGGDRLELINLPHTYTPTGGELKIEMSPSLAASIFQGLEALEETDNPDMGSVVSRFLPNLETYLAMRKLAIDAPELQARLERTLASSVQAIIHAQNADGGWEWWPRSTYNYNVVSDPYLTAYILFGLSRAKEAGLDINQYVMENATRFLVNSMEPVTPQTDQWKTDRMAFILFALQSVKTYNPEYSNQLFENRANLSDWAKGLLALTLVAEGSANQERTTTLVSDLQSTAIRSATGVHWEAKAGWHNPGSTIMTSAMVIYTLGRLEPSSVLLPDAIRYLAVNRNASRMWGSPYETAWVLMGLTEVMQGTGDLQANFNFSAMLNDIPMASGQASGINSLTTIQARVPLSELYPEGPNALVFSRDPGMGRLYYRADLRVDRPAEAAQPISNGLNISRAYYLRGQDCREVECSPIHEISLPEGSLPQPVTVRLVLTLPQDMFHFMVEDFVPAGAEIYNPILKTSQKGAEALPEGTPFFDPSDPYLNGYGWWWFHEAQIYNDHIAWAADYLPAGTYELTYILLPSSLGEFQVMPAHAWQYFFPEVQATSAGDRFTITR
ncbi:MAG TPA: Ig-like domain-containing protein [Anaerolineaceae bacterium]|nr:Ig-like domain-containing protein [Anaerolineaceae bacterium]HPN49956.1 Ig-like domain-containing protein [Anaerolineaceae bacterium]